MSLHKLLLVLASFLLCAHVCADGDKQIGDPIDPSMLLKRIEQNGATAVAAGLEDSQWAAVIKNVEVGEKPWLEVAAALHRATDAGLSEMLSLAVGVALAHAPREVLLIAGRELSVTGVCGFPDMADTRTDTQQKTLAYLNARLEAVRNVKGTDVATLRMKCLQELRKAKRQAASPSGPFNGGTQ